METKNNQSEVPSSNTEKKEKSSFILKHKMVFFLLFLLIAFSLAAFIKLTVMKNQFNNEKEVLVDKYEVRIDSINLANMEVTTKVLSWAIRSEMTRDNMEQVNQLLLNFVKEPNINKLYLIDPFTFKVILSTDKKEEGQIMQDNENLNVDKIVIELNRFISPIMGLNSKIGILIIELKTKEEVIIN